MAPSRSACAPSPASGRYRYSAGSESIARPGIRECRICRADDTNSIPASLARRSHVSIVCSAGAAGGDLAVLYREPPNAMMSCVCLTTEGQSVTSPGHRPERAENARQEEIRGAEAVIADLIDAAAAEEQESPRQCACVVNAPGRRPAVGAAEDRTRAVICRARAQVRCGDRVERLVPRDFAEICPSPCAAFPLASLRGSPAGRCAEANAPSRASTSSMSDGAGSRANGSQPTRRPFSTRAVNAPQWASWEKRAMLMGDSNLSLLAHTVAGNHCFINDQAEPRPVRNMHISTGCIDQFAETARRRGRNRTARPEAVRATPRRYVLRRSGPARNKANAARP